MTGSIGDAGRRGTVTCKIFSISTSIWLSAAVNGVKSPKLNPLRIGIGAIALSIVARNDLDVADRQALIGLRTGRLPNTVPSASAKATSNQSLGSWGDV